VRIELNSAENIAESFHIVWPIGATVLHKKSGKTLQVLTAPQTLDDEKIEQAQQLKSK
jgi:hypothetical protein